MELGLYCLQWSIYGFIGPVCNTIACVVCFSETGFSNGTCREFSLQRQVILGDASWFFYQVNAPIYEGSESVFTMPLKRMNKHRIIRAIELKQLCA